jgi:hypothetical protein
MLFKEIIAVNNENHKEPINTLWGQNTESVNVKVAGAYTYYWTLKC